MCEHTQFEVDTQAIKKRMIDQNLEKIVDLSTESGIDRNTLSAILGGKARPSTRVMESLIDCLKIPLCEVGSIFFNRNLRNE